MQNGYKALSSLRTFTGCLVISVHYNWNFGIELWYSVGGEGRAKQSYCERESQRKFQCLMVVSPIKGNRSRPYTGIRSLINFDGDAQDNVD